MDYKQSLAYLNRFTNYERFSKYDYRKSFNLSRIKRLLALFDNPQSQFSSVLIAGTKGKGSTAAFLTNILSASGFKSGLYTSPHLISIRERVKINGRPISEKDFSTIICDISKVVGKNRLRGLTFFEILTAATFIYFAKERVDIAILEVGLGGRLDATNIVSALVSIITPISYDHTHILGSSISKIAYEKSGIIKKNSFAVSASQPKEAKAVIRSRASERSGELIFTQDQFAPKNIRVSYDKTEFDIKTPANIYRNLTTQLVGTHQAQNSALAICAAEALGKRLGFKLKKSNVRKGLARSDIRGRFDIVSKKPVIVLDGCQNEASAQSLKKTLAQAFPRKEAILVLGVSSDKDAEAIGRVLCPVAKEVIFTQANSVRAMDSNILAQKLNNFCKISYVCADSKDAMTFAKSLANKDDIIVVTGSLFLVGDILKKS
ncbi:bifunctional folylpolyglutamate synthase/dihydrofolate synthase [Candidatus Omnitrophota bacterium]